jgi:hypothetical protein
MLLFEAGKLQRAVIRPCGIRRSQAGRGKLTLNATDRILYQACEAKGLVERKPYRPLAETKCRLFVTSEVNDVLDGRMGEFGPMAEMEKIIATTAAGYAVTVSLLGDPNGRKPDLERLTGLDEVWAFCARRPRHFQVRMFGCFLAKGVFVGLDIHDRNALAGRRTYNEKAALIPGRWESVFGANVKPLTGNSVDMYLNGIPRDVDQIV